MVNQNLYLNIEKKLDEVHSVVRDVQRGQAELKSEVRSMRDSLNKQGDRVAKLEGKAEDGIKKDAETATRVGHNEKEIEKQDAVHDKIFVVLDQIRASQWKATGVILFVAGIVPILLTIYAIWKG